MLRATQQGQTQAAIIAGEPGIGKAPPAELAHHALAAHLAEPALRYSLAAGDEAMSLFAVRDALVYYEQARVVASELSSVTSHHSLYTNLSRAYELTGDFERAKAAAEEMLTLAQAANEMGMICAALNRLASLAIYTHQLETAAAHLNQALKIASQNEHKRWLAETEWSLAQLTHHQYDMQASRDHSARALLDLEAATAAHREAAALNEVSPLPAFA